MLFKQFSSFFSVFNTASVDFWSFVKFPYSKNHFCAESSVFDRKKTHSVNYLFESFVNSCFFLVFLNIIPIFCTTQLDEILLNGYIPPDFAARALQSEKDVRKKFYGPGFGYNCFCYMLLDPRILGTNIETVTFEKFVKSVFYVGKGTGGRPLDHFRDARKELEKPPNEQDLSEKYRRIGDIWKAGFGIPKHEISHGVSDKAALIKEACMIDAIQVKNLTNQKKGEFHGFTKSWDMNTKEEFGSYELHKLRPSVQYVFYVGKGTRSRTLAHFRDVRKELSRPPNEQKLTEKYRRIGDLWKAGFRIPKHQFTHGVSDKEAFIFSPELNAVIRNGRFSRDSLERALRCENAVRNNFDPRVYMAFCYVLIDPRVSGVNIETLTFETFVKSVFYIAKGSNSRPLQHFIDARNEMDKATNDQKMNKKLQTIVDIWSSGFGVPKIQFCNFLKTRQQEMCLYNFQLTECQMMIKEACMIDAIQVKNLTNQKGGVETENRRIHIHPPEWTPRHSPSQETAKELIN
ncbi:hypothetical protein CRE_02429 [Caenorhabditis remanei]|uniref:GIY-YIG domain-containing protein n=1 Tax=Caenorhabditis remanei TaxID=31234 RepID=E3MIQ3_CAERE|nr:hypothetical protein CRE_02429 [Caenorhabditis remanei]